MIKFWLRMWLRHWYRRLCTICCGVIATGLGVNLIFGSILCSFFDIFWGSLLVGRFKPSYKKGPACK